MEPRKSSSFQKWKVSSENVDNIPAPLASTQDKSPGSNVLNSEWREILDKNIDKQKISQTFHKSHVKSFKELPKPQPFKFYCKELSTEHNLDVNSITSSSKLNYPSEFPALGERNIKKNNYRTDCFRPSTSILGHGLENKNEIGVIDNEERNKFLSNQKTDDNTLNNHKLDETKATKKVPRTQRPMTVDLFQASESLKMKKLQSKSISKMSKRILKRRVEKKPYGGNILDSDQPLIHKGKIRLNKKKRVTKIKTVILEKRSSWKTKKNEWKLALDSSEKIKLTSDMIKDTLLLKSCNFILRQRKELSSSIGETKSSSEIITECKNQVISSLVNANYSIDELPEEDHKNSQDYLDDNLNIIDSQIMTPKRMIHSKRFAIYCDQWPMAEMTTAVNELLMKLDCFQQKTQACDPLKLYSKRRFNLGLTEVTKYLRLGKIVMVIFATDIEEIDGKGGLLDTINNIRRMASLQKVPYVFANTQKKLKGILKKNARISCIGIRNYEGADTHFKTILELLPEAKRLYKERLEDAEKMCGIKNQEAELDPNVAVVQSLLSKLTSPSAQKDDEVKSAKNNSVEEECPFLSAIIKHGESST